MFLIGENSFTAAYQSKDLSFHIKIRIGNKVDKETERRVPKTKATAWCKSKGPKPVPYFETSAKEAIKVEVAFLEAAQMALHQESSPDNDTGMYCKYLHIHLSKCIKFIVV